MSASAGNVGDEFAFTNKTTATWTLSETVFHVASGNPAMTLSPGLNSNAAAGTNHYDFAWAVQGDPITYVVVWSTTNSDKTQTDCYISGYLIQNLPGFWSFPVSAAISGPNPNGYSCDVTQPSNSSSTEFWMNYGVH